MNNHNLKVVRLGVSINTIDTIDTIDTNNKIDTIGIYTSDVKAKSVSSSRSLERTETKTLDFISDETSIVKCQEKSGIGGRPAIKDYESELAEQQHHTFSDITYAKISIFEKKDTYELMLQFRDETMTLGKLVKAAFSMTVNTKDFRGNLNKRWGPGTSDREPYATLVKGLRTGELEYIGKGRRVKPPGVKSQKLGTSIPSSVAYISTNTDQGGMRVGISHLGFEWKWWFVEAELKNPNKHNMIASKQYRRSIEYGY